MYKTTTTKINTINIQKGEIKQKKRLYKALKELYKYFIALILNEDYDGSKSKYIYIKKFKKYY